MGLPDQARMTSPLISVILCFRNPGPVLAEALRSLEGQAEDSWELVLVDGASTDGSAGLVSESLRPRLRLVSGPDRGVYDAMNKGLALAQGEWVYFLGADDRLEDPQVLGRAAALLRLSQAALVSGSVRYADGRRYAGRARNPVARNFLHHQGTFYRRRLFATHGGFDIGFRIQADYDFNLRVLRAGERHEEMPLSVAVCGCGGLSDAGCWLNYREEIRVRHRHFPVWRCLVWDLGSVVRYLRKRFLRKLRTRPE
jgi:glycosyltransferase involved in cell wall biosynthesis